MQRRGRRYKNIHFELYSQASIDLYDFGVSMFLLGLKLDRSREAGLRSVSLLRQVLQLKLLARMKRGQLGKGD